MREGHLALLDLQDLWERLDNKANLAHVAHPDLRAPRDRPGLQEREDLQGRQDL